MPALLASDGEIPLPHRLDDIADADGGADNLAPGGGDRFIETEVAHDGCNESLASQAPAFQCIKGCHGKDLVAVDNLAGLIAEHQSIGIPIV